MAILPKVKLKALVSFPSSIVDGAGVDVTKINGAFKIDLAFDDFAPPVSGVSDAAHQNALLWNNVTNTYVLAPITILGSGGAVPEAPNDGIQYARQSLSWTAVTGGLLPSNTSPAMDGTATPGLVTVYSRGDHVHPTDTSRAPLASPVFTGDPRAPTPTAGDSDTSLATTAFVTTAVAAIPTSTPSNASPAMDGIADPGVLTLYSRGDHVHPSDTTKQTLDADLTAIAALGGTGIARRTSTTPAWSAGDPVTNSELSVMPIYTLKGNSTSSLAAPTDIDIAALPAKTTPAGGDFLLLSDQAASGALRKVGIANLPGASGGITDAPNDGLQYGRQSLGWSLIPGGGASPSNALPAMDGPASAGVATLYSRGDHVHPVDTSRAPLASPTFTGDPKAPTPTAGDNDTSIATTAFVTAAVAGVTVVSPSNANPIVDGTAGPGVSALYSRGDHIHPTDTSRAPLASPTFTGDPKAPTPTAGDNDTSIATTAFVTSAVNAITTGFAPVVSPSFTGDPRAPTPTAGDNDTSVATTAFVTAALTASGATGAVSYSTVQSLTSAQQLQAQQNIYAAPFDAMAYSGMQINGSMEVSQENGGVQFTPVNGVVKYAVDGWTASYAHAAATASFRVQQQPVFGSPSYGSAYPYNLQLYAATALTSPAANDYARLYQPIEGWRVSRLGWGSANAQSLTIGFWVYATVAGTMAVSVCNSAANRSYPVNVVVNAPTTWEWHTVTIPGDTTGTWLKDNGVGLYLMLVFACGSSLRGTNATWSSTLYYGTASTTNFFASNANQVNITGVVVLPGTQAPTAAQSPMIMRPYDQELVTCQRYFQRIGISLAFTASGSGSVLQLPFSYTVGMRVTPSHSLAAVDPIAGGGALSNVASGTFSAVTPYSFSYALTAGAAGISYIVNHFTNADARL